MEKTSIIKILAAALAAVCLSGTDAAAQNSVGFNTRTSAEIDWKAARGLHLSAGYELRTKDSFAGVERHQASVGVEYKVCDWFKVGAEYIFIGHYNSSETFRPRHRVSLNLTGQYDAGSWRFSLKEKLQLTHKAYDLNPYQSVPNQLQLKSRFTVKYRGLRKVEPYAYFELRNIFNAPRCSATWSETSAAYTDYEFLGYNDAYVNRLRGSVGLDWNISKRHGIDFSLMYNHTRSLEIDTDKAGTKLKSLGWEKSDALSLCVGYKFSF